ncbi:MAG: class II glutamine amidotransferase [Pseudomonadota bacterium]
MCELFAMSARVPSSLNYSLNEFAKHGGLTHKNKSGWGIAYFEGEDVFLVKEPLPASDSGLARYISEEGRKSDCVIAHVRLATIGEPQLKNTHPFRRALAGRMHVFAHNGTLKGIHDDHDATALYHQPIGDTDSEMAFCILMDRMRELWMKASPEMPAVDARMQLFAAFATEMKQRGSANFLYSDGELLFAHAHRRIYEEEGGFSEARAPGMSIRNCQICQHSPEYAPEGLHVEVEDQNTILLASVPLDDSGWEPLPEGVVLAIRHGVEVGRVHG